MDINAKLFLIDKSFDWSIKLPLGIDMANIWRARIRKRKLTRYIEERVLDENRLVSLFFVFLYFIFNNSYYFFLSFRKQCQHNTSECQKGKMRCNFSKGFDNCLCKKNRIFSLLWPSYFPSNPGLAQRMLEHLGLSCLNVRLTLKGLVVCGQGEDYTSNNR